MPALDDILVVRMLKKADVPINPFVTAHDECGTRAFEVNAADDLLTPELRIGRERRRKNLDRDGAVPPRVARPIALAHAAGAERCDDLVRPSRVPGLSELTLYRPTRQSRCRRRR